MNRRAFLTQVPALAALTALTPPPAKAAPRAKTPGELEMERRENDRYGAPGSEQRRRTQAGLALLLPCWREVEDAAHAALKAHECGPRCRREGAGLTRECVWEEDVEGLRFLAANFNSMLEGEAYPDVERAVRLERVRRARAFRRGAHHGCPVLWTWRALRRAREAVEAVIDAEPSWDGWLARMAGPQLWAVDFMQAVMRDRMHLHMSPAAHDAHAADVKAEYAAARAAEAEGDDE